MGVVEPARFDGVGLAERVRRGEVTAKELLKMAVAQIARAHATRNAAIHCLDERVGFGSPGGPLQGILFLRNDVPDPQGMPLTLGSALTRGRSAPPASELLERVDEGR